MMDWHLHASFKMGKGTPRVCFASRLQKQVLKYVMRLGECILPLTCYLKHAKSPRECVLHRKEKGLAI